MQNAPQIDQVEFSESDFPIAEQIAKRLGYGQTGGDYVRDVSFPVGSIERAAKWQPEPVYVDAWTRAARDKAYCRPSDNENDEGGAPDGNQVHPQFNESDCGGVFDGNQVTSDADPGL